MFRLELFRMLSQDGRNLEYFETEAGPFLVEWMCDVINSTKMADFLQVLSNVVRYNAAYLDEDVLNGFIA